MPKQFTLRFPLFVWHPDKSVRLQMWEARAPEGSDARGLRVCAYKEVGPNGDRIVLFTLRDVRDGVVEYWPVSTDIRFALVHNMELWGFKMVREEPIYGNSPPGHSYCGACGDQCTTIKGLGNLESNPTVSSCCWASIWADPSLTVEWQSVEVVP